MIATPETTLTKITARHPVRGAFAGKSTGGRGTVYYASKGCAVSEFDAALAVWGLSLDEMDCMSLPGDTGYKTLAVRNGEGDCVGYAYLSWFRMESGRYEFVGYIS